MGLIVLVIMGLWYLFLYLRDSISSDIDRTTSYNESKINDCPIYSGSKGAIYHTKTNKRCYIQFCEKGGRIFRSAEKHDFGTVLEARGNYSKEELNKRV